MKNNFVSKHMNTYNKHSVHKDRLSEQLENDQYYLNEGLQEWQEFNKTDENKINEEVIHEIK